jgi:hypothetical protein
MPEIKTKLSEEQITAYEEMYNLNPHNNRATIVNMMRLEGMIQELQAEISLMK